VVILVLTLAKPLSETPSDSAQRKLKSRTVIAMQTRFIPTASHVNMSLSFDLHTASRLATDRLTGLEYEAGRGLTDCVNTDTVLNRILKKSSTF